jgi:hypothetical protein
MASIQKLIDRVNALKADLKDANTELKEELEGTVIFREVLASTLDQANALCKVPEKVARAHALKVAQASYAKEEES